jgi:hypothetical protein
MWGVGTIIDGSHVEAVSEEEDGDFFGVTDYKRILCKSVGPLWALRPRCQLGDEESFRMNVSFELYGKFSQCKEMCWVDWRLYEGMSFGPSAPESKRFLYFKIPSWTQNDEEAVCHAERVLFSLHPQLAVGWAQDNDDECPRVVNTNSWKSEVYAIVGMTRLELKENVDRAPLNQPKEIVFSTVLCRVFGRGQSPDLPPATRRHNPLHNVSCGKARTTVGVYHVKSTTLEPSRVKAQGLTPWRARSQYYENCQERTHLPEPSLFKPAHKVKGKYITFSGF